MNEWYEHDMTERLSLDYTGYLPAYDVGEEDGH